MSQPGRAGVGWAGGQQRSACRDEGREESGVGETSQDSGRDKEAAVHVSEFKSLGLRRKTERNAIQ